MDLSRCARLFPHTVPPMHSAPPTRSCFTLGKPPCPVPALSVASPRTGHSSNFIFDPIVPSRDLEKFEALYTFQQLKPVRVCLLVVFVDQIAAAFARAPPGRRPMATCTSMYYSNEIITSFDIDIV